MPTTSSPNHQTIEFLIQYLFRGNPEQAVMLTGEWGCGKTWLVRNAIGPKAEENGYKVVYVTLLGLRDLESLQDRVVAPLVGTLFADLPAGGQIADAIPGVLERIGLGGTAKNLRTARELGSVVSNWMKDRALKKALEGRLLLVFDDLERCSIPIDDMLGYFSSLIGSGNSRVIVISNEKAAKERSDGWYESIKEKLVSHTLRIHADIPGFLDATIGGWPDGNFKSELVARRALIEAKLHRLSEPNLRAVRVAFTNCSLLSDAMSGFTAPPGLEQGLRKTREWFFEMCFCATMFKRMKGKSGKDYLDRFGMHAAIAAQASANSPGSLEMAQEEVNTELFIKNLSGDLFSIKDPPDFLSALVDDGRLDRIGIISYLKSEYRTDWTQLQRDLHMVENGFVVSLSDQEAHDTYDRVFYSLTHDQVKDPATFLASSSQLMSSAGLTWVAPVDHVEKLLEAARSCHFEATERLNRESPFWTPEVAPIQEALNKNIVNRNAATIQRRVQQAYVSDGPFGALELAADDQDPGFHSGILCHLNADTFWTTLAASSNDTILNAQRKVSFRIQRGNALHVPKNDEGWLLSGIPILERIIAERAISPSRRHLQSILGILTKTRSEIAAQNAPPPTPISSVPFDGADGEEEG